MRIAIDDFGTGYSSLSYLRQMPVDVLKIDKSFIDDILHSDDQLALVSAIVSLARTLKLTVVAEGVEYREHHDALRAMGCPYGQGYLFSRPLPADRTAEWLAPAPWSADRADGPTGGSATRPMSSGIGDARGVIGVASQT